MRELITNKNIYLQFIFHCIIGKKSSPQIQLFKLYKIGYLSVDSETLEFFGEELHGIGPQEQPHVLL